MNVRESLPGLITGVLGLAAGVIGTLLEVRIFGVVAGLLALAAGVAGLRLGQRLEEQAAVQSLVEDELRSIRTNAAATEQRLIAELDHDDIIEDENTDVEVLTDPSTGLFSESFFTVALESRVAAARRHLRPVAIILLEVVEGVATSNQSDADAELVAEAIRVTLREADTACRLRNGYFALLLEDTPENGAIWTVERIRRQLLGSQQGLTLWAGVACYPAHAFSPNEIMSAAETALEAAREWRQDRIEVAIAAAD